MRTIPQLPPIDFSPSNTCVVFDFEKTLTKHNVLLDLYRISPFKTFKATLEGIKDTFVELLRNGSHRNFKYIWTSDTKRAYCKNLTRKERIGLGRRIYQIDRRTGLEGLFHVIGGDGYDLFILTSCDENIARGFLESFNPKGSSVEETYNYKILGSTGDKMIWIKDKEEFVKEMKKHKKYLVFTGDCEVDEGALNNSDYPFVVYSSILSNLMGINKIRGHRVSLTSLKGWFDYIHYRRQGII